MTYFKWKKPWWKVNTYGFGSLLKGSFENPSCVGRERFECRTNNNKKCEVRDGIHANAGDLEPHQKLSQAERQQTKESTRQASTKESLCNNKLLRTGVARTGKTECPQSRCLQHAQSSTASFESIRFKKKKKKVTEINPDFSRFFFFSSC